MPSQSGAPIVIYIAGYGQHWTARAYEDAEDGRHIWSSEDASSVTQALNEISEAVEAYVRGPADA